MSNEKKFNIFNILSVFSKTMIEYFIAIILLKIGFNLRDILIFYAIKYFLEIFFTVIAIILGRKIGFIKIIFIGFIFLILGFYNLYHITISYQELIMVSISLSLFTAFYWVSRHYYALSIIKNENIINDGSSFIIYYTLATIPASIIGAFLLEQIGVIGILIVVLILTLTSLIPLTFIKIKRKRLGKIIKTLKKIPNDTLMVLSLEQFKYVAITLFPIYIYFYVNDTFKYIGAFNVCVGIASVIFIYFFSKLMNKTGKDYLFISSLILFIVLFLKLNTTNQIVMLLIAFMQGISTKMHDTSISKIVYNIGKDLNVYSYIVIYTTMINLFRVLLLILFLFIYADIKTILYLCSAGIMFMGIFNYKSKRYKNSL